MSATAAAPWQNRIVGHADIARADLVPNPRNWRTHPPEQQRAMGGALAEVGWVTGVVVNRTTGNVVDGTCGSSWPFARQGATGPVTYVELTEDEEALVLARLDPIGAVANAEATALASLLSGLEPADDALRALLDDLMREQGIDLARGWSIPMTHRTSPRSQRCATVSCMPLATIACCAAMRPTRPTSGVSLAMRARRT